ncbi:unnamed protein product, partial [Polarella glacialis]
EAGAEVAAGLEKPLRRIAAAADSGAPAGDQDGGSSAGSELGSDLDDSEFDEPETDDLLLAEISKVQRSKKRWSVQLRGGVLRIAGSEMLFARAVGIFDVDEEQVGGLASLPP